MKKAGTTSPVFMLDEVDKLGSDYRGDPSSACSRCSIGAERHLRRPLPGSTICPGSGVREAANVGDTIPPALRDRMEIIEIPGYTRAEKLSIARRHLLPKQLREHGMTAEQVDVTDEAIETVIDRRHARARRASVQPRRRLAAIVRAVVVKRPRARSTARWSFAPRRTCGARRSGQVHQRGGRAHGGRRRGDALAAGRRLVARSSSSRPPGCRQGQAHSHRAARRRDEEGERDCGAQLRARERRAIRHPAQLRRGPRHPHPRAGGRGAQRRPERRRDVHRRARLAPHQRARAPRRRDDRRDHPAWTGPAHRWPEEKVLAARRAGIKGHRPGAQPRRPRCPRKSRRASSSSS